jgi:ATP-binding protein involved in chromosome partitioning
MDSKKVGLSDTMKAKTEPKSFRRNPIKGTKYTIAISSAKGGVGKSTFATNLALALKKLNLKVGILDADIYGPSLPKLFDINQKPETDGQNLIPILKYGIQCMSIGFLTDEQTPMIWRGPMVTSAIKTFTQKVLWSELDFIIIDMPPGTGDTQLTFAQEILIDGVIIVSTPQEIALQDVRRGIKMFEKLKVNIIGLIDNMSYFIGDDQKKYPIFGEGTVKLTAKEFNKDLLAEIPINPEVGKCGDQGEPIVENKPDHTISKIYIDIAKKIKINYFENKGE